MPINKANGKKNGLQKYRVRVSTVDSYGKLRQKERIAYGIDEARYIEMELMKELETSIPQRKMSLNELCDEYLTSKKNEVRESSLDKSKRILSLHVLPYLGNKSIDKINVPTVESWKQKIGNLSLSATSKHNIFGEFRALLNFGVKMEYIQSNPLVKAGNFKAPLAPPKEMLFYTPSEFELYITEARKEAMVAETRCDLSGWNYYVFFCIAFYTGMRKGEINALQWTDITENCISVTKSVAQKLKGGDKITPPKNRTSIRTIQMPKPLIAVLAEHQQRLINNGLYDDKRYITGTDRPLRDSSINNANFRFAKAAGVKHIRIHDFRHSHASLLANEGINIQEIARRLGHSKISQTWETYSHLYPREEEKSVKILDNIPSGASPINPQFLQQKADD